MSRNHEDEVLGGAHDRPSNERSSLMIDKTAKHEIGTYASVKSELGDTYGFSPAVRAFEALHAALPEGSAERKEYPIYEGLFKYFPHALAAVAHVSYVGNQKHNPGQPLHWSRDKSNDHLNCIARHLLEAGSIDQTNGVRHSAQLAWRALANLQIEIEKSRGINK